VNMSTPAASIRVGRCAQRAWRAVRARPLHMPRNLLIAAAYLGGLGGALLGAISGIVLMTATISSFSGSGYGVGEGVFALMAAVVLGSVVGLVVGIFNGAMMSVLSRTFVLRGKAGIRWNGVAAVAVATTAASGLAVLHVVMVRTSAVFVYLPAIAGALLALPLSRKLPLR
jgi:hypothetical protein